MSPFSVEIGGQVRHKASGIVAVVESRNTYETVASTRHYYGVRFENGRLDLFEVCDVEPA